MADIEGNANSTGALVDSSCYLFDNCFIGTGGWHGEYRSRLLNEDWVRDVLVSVVASAVGMLQSDSKPGWQGWLGVTRSFACRW